MKPIDVWKFGRAYYGVNFSEPALELEAIGDLGQFIEICEDCIQLIDGILTETDEYDPERASVETFSALEEQLSYFETAKTWAELKKK